jgi:repressor LexA
MSSSPEDDRRICSALRETPPVGAGVFHGDLVIVRAQRTAEPGDIVVARTPDGKGTVKTPRQRGQTWCLVADNPKYAAIYKPFEVIGKVTGVIRRHVN